VAGFDDCGAVEWEEGVRFKVTKSARSRRIARSHIMASIERCLNVNGPVDSDYGLYVISATPYRQVGSKMNSGVRVTWKVVR
jgi:hypothetical protein